MLSFSSFGSVDHPICTKVRKAVELLHFADPTLIVDGEIMADDALSPEIIEQSYPVQRAEGRRQRPDLPRPCLGQHCLQAGGKDRRV